MFAGKARSLTKKDGIACQGQSLWLLTNTRQQRRKKFSNIGPRTTFLRCQRCSGFTGNKENQERKIWWLSWRPTRRRRLRRRAALFDNTVGTDATKW